MKKVVRDGKVAVLVSPGFGAGWYSWNEDIPQVLFSPEIVELVERKADASEIIEKAEELFGDKYWRGARGLTIEWIPEGTRFEIYEYDGSESLRVLGPNDGFIA